MKIEKLLIFRDELRIQEHRKKAETLLPLLQNIVQEAKIVDLEITTENFNVAVHSPETFATQEYLKLIPEQTSVGPFKKKKSAIIEELELPNLTKFIAACKGFRQRLPVTQADSSYFEIVNGRAVISESGFQSYVDGNSIYISHPKEIKLWNSCAELFQRINEFNEMLFREAGNKAGIDLVNFRMFADYDETGKLKPRLGYFIELAKMVKSVNAGSEEDLL